jgi:hypothetical protein
MRNKLDPSFNYTFRDIDDVLPLNNMHNQSNTTDTTCGAERAYPSGAHFFSGWGEMDISGTHQHDSKNGQISEKMLI